MSDWPQGSPSAEDIRAWCARLRTFPTLEAFRASTFHEQYGGAIVRLLGTPHTGGPPPAGGAFRRPPFYTGVETGRRIVHWNILKGIAFPGIARAFLEHPRLQGADLILLNEVDVGMARSGNRHVAADLAGLLGMHWIYQPNYLELTKGPGPDAASPGENETGLHGVAVLSRAAPLAYTPIPLPTTFEMFSFHEKRLGQRVGLAALFPDGSLVGTAHHEVRGTPLGRALQMQAFLGGVSAFERRLRERGYRTAGVLLSGDLNTHTFPRGTLGRAIRGALRLLFTSEKVLRRQFDEPWRSRREPLFAVLAERGYEWVGLNASGATAYAPVALIEEGDRLAPVVRDLLRRSLPFVETGIPLHLDWFFGRGLAAAPAPTATIVADLEGPGQPSDHAPIVLDLP